MDRPWIKRAVEYRRLNKVIKHRHVTVGRLSIRVKYPDEEEWTDLGVVSEAIVTAGAIAQIISVLQGGSASTLQNFKFHASGTGT
ncbi:MAG: hypothetical protein MN733_23455, partial [Nitrososphaera sp.]|nr:hypothetical protein [Nitrososphaera sp.]